MSNTKSKRVQLRLDVPVEIKEKLQRVSSETGYSMVRIVTSLVTNNLSTLDIDYDVRRALAEVAQKNRQELKLSKRQKQVIKNVARDEHTKDLL